MDTKVCPRCEDEKPLGEFGKRNGQPQSHCKLCASKTTQRRRRKLQSQGLCRCGLPLASASRCLACLQKANAETAKVKLDTIEAYGGKCKCCGEQAVEFLSMDHIGGGGTQHRKLVGGGKRFYLWLKREGYPQDGRFRLLCMNCNFALGKYGYCPHEGVSNGTWLQQNKEQTQEGIHGAAQEVLRTA